MPRKAISDYQDGVKRQLNRLFPNNVEKEWRTQIGKSSYSPRLDPAVGPFAMGPLQCAADYDRLSWQNRALVRRLHDLHRDNAVNSQYRPRRFNVADAHFTNPNARCFLAIEIENRGSRKHMLGGTMSAMVLGRFGITVGWTEASFRSLLRAREYLCYLSSVGNSTMATTNRLVLRAEQLEQVLAAP